MTREVVAFPEAGTAVSGPIDVSSFEGLAFDGFSFEGFDDFGDPAPEEEPTPDLLLIEAGPQTIKFDLYTPLGTVQMDDDDDERTDKVIFFL